MMKLEWLVDNASTGVLRLDVIRPEHGSEDKLQASLVKSFWDEEGCALAHMQWFAGPALIRVESFSCSTVQSDWITFAGEIVAGWDEHWRVTSTRLCRIGKMRTGNRAAEREPRLVWDAVTPGHLLIREYIALMEGAASVYSGLTGSANMDESHVKLDVAKCLSMLRISSRRDLASLVAHL